MADVVRLIVNELLHPLFSFLVPAKEMQGILAAAPVHDSRIHLEHFFKVRICIRALPSLAEYLSAHQVDVGVFLIHIYPLLVAFHCSWIIPGEFIAPAFGVICERICGIYLNCPVKSLDCLLETTFGSQNLPFPAVVVVVIVQSYCGIYLTQSLFSKAKLAVAVSPVVVDELIFSIIVFQGIVLGKCILVLPSLFVDSKHKYSPLALVITGPHLSLRFGNGIRPVFHHHFYQSSTKGVAVLFIPGKCLINSLVRLSELIVRPAAHFVGAGVVGIIFYALVKHPNGALIISALNHVACEAHHRCGITFILLEHLTVHGIRLVQELQFEKALSQIKGDALHVILVVFPGQVQRLAQAFHRLAGLTQGIVHRSLPPPECGVVEAGFLGLVDLDGLIYCGQRGTVFFAISVDAAQQHPALHVIRR